MSETTQQYLFGFWNLIDELLNSVLFLLIGLEVLVLQFDPSLAPLVLITVPIVLLAMAVFHRKLTPERRSQCASARFLGLYLYWPFCGVTLADRADASVMLSSNQCS